MIVVCGVSLKVFIKERKRRQKQLRLEEAFERLVYQHKLAVEYSEFFDNRYIGLDRKNRKLALIDHSGKEKREQCISLFQIEESRIVHVKDDSGNITSVLLELRRKHSNELLQFCFYNSVSDRVRQLVPLSRKTIQWKNKIDLYRRRGSVNYEAEYVL